MGDIEGLNLASGNNFQLIFPDMPGQETTNELFSLNIYETIIPEVSFAENITNWQGWDFKFVTSNMDFATWSFNFDINEKFENWKKIFKWMLVINNNKDKAGASLDEYAIDSSLYITDNYNNTILNLKMINTIPLSLGSVTISHRDGENYLSSVCTLSYSYFDLVL